MNTISKVTTKKYLIIPHDEFEKISGNKRRRISVIITDPRSRHIILTRYPENLKIWYQTTIERGMDFIPTTILKKAKIHNSSNFVIAHIDGNLVIRRSK